MPSSRRFTSRRAASSTEPPTAGTSFEAILRRDRLIVGAALILFAASSWAYLGWIAADPGHQAMGHSKSAMPGMAPAIEPWSSPQAIAAATMWTVMMVGMMTPSVAPMILIYARVARQASGGGKPFA